jgi:hypothetical protein
MYKYWDETELANVDTARKSGEPLKTLMDLFPGRTLHGVEHQMRKLPKDQRKKRGTVSLTWIATLAILKKSPGSTAQEICGATGFSYRHTIDVLKANHGSDEKCVYISGWEWHGVNQIAQWTMGNEQDAPKLALQSHEESLRKARVRYQKKQIKAGAYNPFAVAAGLVAPPPAQAGRVFAQPMSLWDFNEKEAA